MSAGEREWAEGARKMPRGGDGRIWAMATRSAMARAVAMHGGDGECTMAMAVLMLMLMLMPMLV